MAVDTAEPIASAYFSALGELRPLPQTASLGVGL